MAAPRRFFARQRGLPINRRLVVGTPTGGAGEGSALVSLDGVATATASIRITHDSILAATRAVAREKMKGADSAPPAHPNLDDTEDLDWDPPVAQGLVTRKTVLNREVDDAFAGTVFADDDPAAQADPDGVHLDHFIVDLGPPVIVAALGPQSLRELQVFQRISQTDQEILLIDAGGHGLVSPDVLRTTAPGRLSAEQDRLPASLRNVVLVVTLAPGAPEGAAIIPRTDRRLGVDPTREWTRNTRVTRATETPLPAGCVAMIFIAPDTTNAAADIEAVKTAITVLLVRAWQDVVSAAFWLQRATAMYDGSCRHVGLLGAVMAIIRLVRTHFWIRCRAGCGPPSQLCQVRCNHAAIARGGRVQCRDCVIIHDDPKRCVPLILAARDRWRAA